MSWQQLVGIRREAAVEAANERARVPADCPDCGTALRTGAHGVLFCPWDGWRSDA